MKDKNIERFILCLIFITPLANLGNDIYTPSLPHIAAAFKEPSSMVQFSVTIYLLMYGVGQIIFGILSDFIGRRKILNFGIVLFIISSILISFSSTILLLILFRLFQGISAAVISVISKSMITDKFVGERLKQVSTYKVSAQILSVIFAPILGAVIQYYFGWRYTFVLLSLYSVCSLFMIIKFSEETLDSNNKMKLSNVISSISNILSNRTYMFTITNIGILYGVVALVGVLGTFIIQEKFHLSIIYYAFFASICGLSYIIGNFVGKKLGGKIIYNVYSILMITVALFFLISSAFFSGSVLYYFICMVFIMFSCGLLLPSLMTLSLGFFKEKAGMSSAFLGSLVMLICGFIVWISSLIDFASLLDVSVLYLILSISSIIINFYLIWRGNLLVEDKRKTTAQSLN